SAQPAAHDRLSVHALRDSREQGRRRRRQARVRHQDPLRQGKEDRRDRELLERTRAPAEREGQGQELDAVPQGARGDRSRARGGLSTSNSQLCTPDSQLPTPNRQSPLRPPSQATVRAPHVASGSFFLSSNVPRHSERPWCLQPPGVRRITVITLSPRISFSSLHLSYAIPR